MIKRRILIGSLSGLSFSIRTAIKDEPLMLILPPCFFFFLFFLKGSVLHSLSSVNKPLLRALFKAARCFSVFKNAVYICRFGKKAK